jgi:hypothetical protein
MQKALESALAELTLGPEILPGDAPAIDAWLARHEVTPADAGALLRDFPRLLVYRRLGSTSTNFCASRRRSRIGSWI